MIIGIGTDIVDIRRIKEMLDTHGQRFLDRCFTQAEQDLAAQRAGAGGGDIARYAKAFAAKEALAKALGTGFTGGVSWQDMTVGRTKDGAPTITLSGTAQAKLSTMTGNKTPHIHLSISDEKDYAQAFVIIEAL